jgi:lysophospholipase L1-like esterase
MIHAVKYSILSLGDSYTIGEGVPERDSFPYQLSFLLGKIGYPFAPPQIIARTGWTTHDLQVAIPKARTVGPYDLVSLLIGVNNQYQGLGLEDYGRDFTDLLNTAIRFSRHGAREVLVLSIPDWGVTPFARGRDSLKIRQEIDQFNRVNRQISLQAGCPYVDICPGTRNAAVDPGLLAPDGLHPSGKEYARWAAMAAEQMDAMKCWERGKV